MRQDKTLNKCLKTEYNDVGSRSQVAPRVSLVVKFAPVCETCPNGPWTPLRQGKVAAKSNSSGFWTFWTSKLTNFKTRLWTRGTCHVYSEGTCG